MPSLPRGHLLITYSARLVFRNTLRSEGFFSSAYRPVTEFCNSLNFYGFVATWPQATTACGPKPPLIVVSRIDTLSNVPSGAIAPGGAN